MWTPQQVCVRDEIRAGESSILMLIFLNTNLNAAQRKNRVSNVIPYHDPHPCVSPNDV